MAIEHAGTAATATGTGKSDLCNDLLQFFFGIRLKSGEFGTERGKFGLGTNGHDWEYTWTQRDMSVITALSRLVSGQKFDS
jgi:hypothetical protein